MTQAPLEIADLSPLSGLAPALTEMLVTVASDIALVIDGSGVIRSLSLRPGEPIKSAADEWVGQPFLDTVTVESREKVLDLLRDVASTGASRPRHLNHPSPFGMDIPVTYTAVRLGTSGPVLLVGRDMRAVAAIQQRLVRSQQEMERDYWKRRQAETRYRFLFQIAPDPVLVIDARSLNVVDANRVAARLLNQSPEELVGQRITRFLGADTVPALEEFLLRAQTSGRAESGEFALQRGRVRLAATPLDADGESLLVIRVRPLVLHPAQAVPIHHADTERKTEAFAITDLAGRIQMANQSFATIAGLADASAACGRSIGEWLAAGDETGGIATWIAAARESGNVAGNIALAHASDRRTTAHMSATLLSDGATTAVGFVLRPTAATVDQTAPADVSAGGGSG